VTRRDHNVLVELGIAELEHRTRTLPAHLPELLRLRPAARRPKGERVLPGPGQHLALLGLDLAGVARQFQQHDRAARLPREDRGLGLALRAQDRIAVQELADRRLHPLRKQRPHRREGRHFAAEGAEQGPARRGIRDQFEDGVGHHPQHALAADPEVAEIEAGGKLLGRRPPLHVFPSRQEPPQGEDEVARDAVLAAVHAPGVAGDVAPDRAVLAGRGVRRIEPALRLHRAVNVGDLRPGLDKGHAGLRIDADPIPAEQIEHPAAPARRGRAREGGAATPDRDRDPVGVGQRQDHADVGVVARENHGLRQKRQLQPVEGRRGARLVGRLDDLRPQPAPKEPGGGCMRFHGSAYLADARAIRKSGALPATWR
jgi:hypothetical protein